MINFTTENIANQLQNAGCAMACLTIKAMLAEAGGDMISSELYMEKVEMIGLLRYSLKCFEVDSTDCLTNEEAISAFSSLNELIGCNCYDCLECNEALSKYEKLQDPYLFPNKYSPVTPDVLPTPETGRPIFS